MSDGSSPVEAPPAETVAPTPQSQAPPVSAPPLPPPPGPSPTTTSNSVKKAVFITLGCVGLLIAGSGIAYLTVRPAAAPLETRVPETDTQTTELEILQEKIDQLQSERRAVESELKVIREESDVWSQEKQGIEQEISTLEGHVTEQSSPSSRSQATLLRRTYPLLSSLLPKTPVLALAKIAPLATLFTVQEVQPPAEQKKTLSEKLDEEYKALREQVVKLHAEKDEVTKKRNQLKKQVESLKKGMTRLHAFQMADFLVLQPQSHCLGIRVLENGQFQVIARAKGRLALSADRMAYSSNIHRVRDNRLARDLWLKSEIAQPLSSSLTKRLKAYWQPRVYVPEKASEMISFHDLRRGQHRVGYYLGHDEASLKFVGISSQPEQAPRSHINVGTAQRGRPEELLEQDDQFDYIDYCLLQVAKKMNSPEESTHHRLAIYAKLDLSEGNFQPIKRTDSGDPINDFLALVASASEQKLRSSQLRGHLEAVRNALEDDVYAKLNKLGISVVERENVRALMSEQNMAGWNKSHRLIDQVLGRKNPFGQLLYATHVLYIELGDSSSAERVRFSVRLNDAYSGEVLWANTSERPIYASHTTQQHLVTSGKVVLINPPKTPSRTVHHPLRMPLLDAHNSPQRTRLVCLEGSQDAAMLELRDLFDHTTTPLSQGLIAGEKLLPIKGVDELPWEHRSRYLVWRICQGILPPAGRVTACSDRRATITLNRANHLTRRGDLLTASRAEPDNYDTSAPVRLRQLPAQLTVTEVSPDSLQVSWADPRVEVLWTQGAPLQVGDLVMRPHPQAPTVVVEQPVVQRPDTAIWKKLKLDNRRHRDKYSQMTEENATQLARLLRQAMLEMRINCLETEQTATNSSRSSSRSRRTSQRTQSSRATHIIRSKISPATGRAFDVHLSVVAAKQKEPVVELTAQLTEQQLANWKP